MKEKYSDGIEWNTYEKLRKERPELFAESTQIPIVTDKETVYICERDRAKSRCDV